MRVAQALSDINCGPSRGTHAQSLQTSDPKMFRAEKAKFWLDPDTLIDLDWDTIMRRRMLDRYNGYDLRRSLYMNPSNGEIKDEPWYSFGQSYSAQYVGEYLTAQGLDKDYEDRRLWIDNKGNSNETLTLHGDLMNNKYDQHGPYGFQTVRYKVPWKYLSNTIGRGYSTDIEITYASYAESPKTPPSFVVRVPSLSSCVSGQAERPEF